MRYAISLLLTLFVCPLTWAEPPTIQISPYQAQHIGERIWKNEGAGKVENLTVWNKGEAFPSFGIGHFIWYPPGVEETFQESFPQLIKHLQKTVNVPQWLTQPNAPWRDRRSFYQDINMPHMYALRALLQNTTAQQTEFIIERMQNSLPLLLTHVQRETTRQHIEQIFYRIANLPNGPYALIDYVNFKGEGISPKERYQEQGWGLLQVLERVPSSTPDEKLLNTFADAADFVLTRRVQNAPRDEQRWLPGWRKRIDSYRNQ